MTRPWKIWRHLVAAAAVALVVGACSGGESPSPVGIESAIRASPSDLDTAVRSASAMVLDSPGIIIEQTEEVGGVVATRLWMDYRTESGEFTKVESVDTLIRSRGRDDDGGVVTTATVLVGDMYFEAVAGSADMPLEASTPWQATPVGSDQDRSEYLPPFIDLAGMASGEYTSDGTTADAYRRDVAGDASEWIVTSPFEQGRAC